LIHARFFLRKASRNKCKAFKGETEQKRGIEEEQKMQNFASANWFVV